MLSDQQRADIVVAAVQSALDDWVSLGELDAIACFYGAPGQRADSGSFRASQSDIEPVVRHLLVSGFVNIGEVYATGSFVPFDGSSDDALRWMMDILAAAEPGWSLSAWLEVTPRGAEFARSMPRARYRTEPWTDENGSSS